MRTPGRRLGLVLLVLVSARAEAEEAEFRLAINIDVRGVRLEVTNLREIVATQSGEFTGVVVIPDNRIQTALSDERASINQKCKAGQLDQKCQISLGSALGATYWLQVSVVRGEKECTVRMSCLSIATETQKGSAFVSTPCGLDDVTKALGAGLNKVGQQLGWGGAETVAVAVAASDPLAEEKARLAEAKRESAREKAEAAARQKQHLVDAARDYAEVEKAAKDVDAPVEARLQLVEKFLEAYADVPEQGRALKLKKRLEADVQQPRLAADTRAAVSAPVDMVLVPAGMFWYGCNVKTDSDCKENPGLVLHLPAFRIDKTEVTVADYAGCVQAGQCSKEGLTMPWWGGQERPQLAQYCNWGRPGRKRHPINCVDFAQARDVCRFMNKRLPTEQEWEKAARGTDGRKYPWGNSPAPGGRVAKVRGSDDGFEGTSAVGSFPAGASPFGALDMIGNVAEWCEHDLPQQDETLRGGAWDDNPQYASSSLRVKFESVVRDVGIGVRCARSAP